MPWLRFALLILIATILQSSFVGVIWIVSADIRPDLLLILLVFFAIRREPREAVITSFIIGLAADLVNSATGFMGPQMISFGLFGMLLSDLHNVISIRRLPYQMAAIFIMGLLTSALSHLLVLLRADPVPISMAREFFWQPMLSALIGPFLFLPVAWWMHMTKRRRRRMKLRGR